MAAAEAAPPPILELDPSHDRAVSVVEDIVRLERRIFPKHESLARSLHDELKPRNSGLIYKTSSADGGEVIGYAMYTCNTSLCATITKLAGETHVAIPLSPWVMLRLCGGMTGSVPPKLQTFGFSEGELQAAGPRRGAAGGRSGAVPAAEGPAALPPRRPHEDGRRGAVLQGRVPGRHHRRGLLRASQGRLPDVLGSVVEPSRTRKPAHVFRQLLPACSWSGLVIQYLVSRIQPTAEQGG